MARSYAWKQSNGSMGQPLGAWGYFFRGLEVLGFVAGGLIVPLALRKAPYCPACQRAGEKGEKIRRSRQSGLRNGAATGVRQRETNSDDVSAACDQQQHGGISEKSRRTSIGEKTSGQITRQIQSATRSLQTLLFGTTYRQIITRSRQANEAKRIFPRRPAL